MYEARKNAFGIDWTVYLVNGDMAMAVPTMQPLNHKAALLMADMLNTLNRHY